MRLISRVATYLLVLFGVAVAIVLLLRFGEAVTDVHLPDGSYWMVGFAIGFLAAARWLPIGPARKRR